jgi:UDP-N-acetylmuramoylalanine--D-glutamate ligase
MAASAASFLNQISTSDIQNAVSTFKGLEHRIEWVGEYAGINWYNDSIATIPEAAMEAIKSLKNVNTLILGGFDRGIDYSILYPFLRISHVKNIIFVGQAGERMLNEFGEHDGILFLQAGNYEEVVSMAAKLTQPGTICLLSPAAASYDMFRNFEERGNAYKKYVRALPSHT